MGRPGVLTNTPHIVAAPDVATPDFTLPSFDPGVLARRAAVPAAVAVVVLLVVVVGGGPLEVLADALRRALAADARWIAVAAVAEALSFAGYVLLLWHVG